MSCLPGFTRALVSFATNEGVGISFTPRLRNGAHLLFIEWENECGFAVSRYTALLESVSTAFGSFPVQEGETMEAYIERMMGFVKKKI